MSIHDFAAVYDLNPCSRATSIVALKGKWWLKVSSSAAYESVEYLCWRAQSESQGRAL